MTTPAASGEWEALRKALVQGASEPTWTGRTLDEHRPLIEAAIRAEAVIPAASGEAARRIAWRHQDCDPTACVVTMEQGCVPTMLVAAIRALGGLRETP